VGNCPHFKGDVMREYPRRVYKDNKSKSVFDETEEIKASSEGWDCASSAEKVALKESKGKGILRQEVPIVKETIKVDSPVLTETKSEEIPEIREEAKPLSPQQRAAITRKKNKRGN